MTRALEFIGGCIGIAGYAVARYAPQEWVSAEWPEISTIAQRLLGLSVEDRMALFAPAHLNKRPAAMAAATLENYALTGKVEWPKP